MRNHRPHKSDPNMGRFYRLTPLFLTKTDPNLDRLAPPNLFPPRRRYTGQNGSRRSDRAGADAQSPQTAHGGSDARGHRPQFLPALGNGDPDGYGKLPIGPAAPV